MIVESKLWSNSFTLSTTKICWQNELVRFLNAGDSSTALFPHFYPFFKNSSFPLPPSWPFYICKYYLYKFLDFFFLDFFRLLVYLKPSLRQFLSFNSFRPSFTIPFLILLPSSHIPRPSNAKSNLRRIKEAFLNFHSIISLVGVFLRGRRSSLKKNACWKTEDMVMRDRALGVKGRTRNVKENNLWIN